MNAKHMEVDRLYEELGIRNVSVLRKNINCGNMNRKLNTNFSAVSESKGRMNFSSSTGNLKI